MKSGARAETELSASAVQAQCSCAPSRRRFFRGAPSVVVAGTAAGAIDSRSLFFAGGAGAFFGDVASIERVPKPAADERQIRIQIFLENAHKR